MELSRDFTPNCDLEIDTDLQTMLSYLRHKLYLSAKYIEQGAGEDSIFGAPTGFMELTRDEMDMVVGGITTSEPCYLDVCTGYTPGTGDDMGCKANACGEQNSGACTIDACGVDGCSQNACAGDAAGGDACGADACYADACGGDACGANACAGDVCGGDACGANACGADACSIDLCGANACAAQGCWVDFIPGVPGI